MKMWLWMGVSLLLLEVAIAQNSAEEDKSLYVIEGRVYLPDGADVSLWKANTNIHVNGGEYLGFIKEDGSFVIHNIPSGSYVVEVVNPDYIYEPVRVEINSKGKYRVRKLNYIQTSLIKMPYPLRLKTNTKYRYFQIREQWRLTDFLFNPMIIMMLMPLILIMILPKMMNDPETKKEMEQITNFTKMQDMPEISEVMTNLFSGGSTAKPQTKYTKIVKKKQ